jgi:hypothetical protein
MLKRCSLEAKHEAIAGHALPRLGSLRRANASKAKALIMDPANELFMSAVSPREMALKAGRAPIDAAVLLQHAKAAGYTLPLNCSRTFQ